MWKTYIECTLFKDRIAHIVIENSISIKYKNVSCVIQEDSFYHQVVLVWQLRNSSSKKVNPSQADLQIKRINKYEVIKYVGEDDKTSIAETLELLDCAADGATYSYALKNIEVGA